MMEHRSVDPYEQQLLKVFNSYDHDKRGSLDRDGLNQLCHNLQLEEHGHELVRCLLKDSKHSRATFSEFKDALLALLGNVQSSLSEENSPTENTSPEREVSPKFVYGSKKYGRRSRPKNEDVPLEKLDENTNYSNNVTVQRSNSQSEVYCSRKRKPNGKLKRCVSLPGHQEYNNRSFESNVIKCEAFSDEQEFLCTEDMLRAAWKRLGVGEDGYLNQTELILVCDAIGLRKLANGVIRQLSDKLDLDFDRRISFQELLEALQQDDAWSDVLNSTLHSQTTNDLSLNLSCVSDEIYPGNGLYQHITLGPDGSGLISIDLITELWENAGVTSPKLLLSDLGFISSQINVIELAAVLEKEIKGINDLQRDNSSPHIALLQATLALYQTEIRCLKSIMEQMQAEREKLKCDVQEANNRATMLAQEVDDNHAKMERNTQNQVKLLEQRHADFLRELQEQFHGEKEQLTLANKSVEERIACLESEEAKLRNDLGMAQKYSNSLEKENLQLRGEINELNRQKTLLHDEIANLEAEKQKCNELEKEHIEPLLCKLNELQLENSGLRDKNDEMMVEIETLSGQIVLMRSKVSSTPTFHNLEHSMEENISGFDGVGVGAKRRSDDSPSKELNVFGTVDGSPRLGKVRKFHRNKDTLEVPFISSESGFDTELDWGESSISYSANDSEETNIRLQNRISALEQLLAQHSIPIPPSLVLNNSHPDNSTMQLTNYCKDLETLLKEVKNSIDEISKQSCCKNCDILKNLNEKLEKRIDKKLFDSAISYITDSPTEKQLNGYLKIRNSCGNSLEKSEVLAQKSEVSTQTSTDLSKLESDNVKYLEEISNLNTKVADLESCVELLKNEYEKCEDYWAGKLDEERQMFEQEQNQSTEKFNDLLVKILEYEKQLEDHDVTDGRLPPIEEKYNLEKQFTDLEQEYEEYKMQTEEQLEEKNKEIFLLQEKLAELIVKDCETKEAEAQADFTGICDTSLDNKMSNLTNHVVESTNLFSADTMPFGWTSNMNGSGHNSLETAIVSEVKQRDYVNPAFVWSKGDCGETCSMSNMETFSVANTDAFSVPNTESCSVANTETLSVAHTDAGSENTTETYSIDRRHFELQSGEHSNVDSSLSTSQDTRQTQSLPATIVWPNVTHNLQPNAFALLDSDHGSPFSSSTPCRPKRTRKYDRNPLGGQRGQKKGSTIERDAKAPGADLTDTVQLPGLGIPDLVHRDGDTRVVSVNTLHHLNVRIHHLEQRCRHLQMTLKQQHFRADQLLQHCWQQHRTEKAELQFFVKSSQERLDYQLRISNNQHEKLARADKLVKELFVENSYLHAEVQRLKQQCLMLTQCNTNSSI